MDILSLLTLVNYKLRRFAASARRVWEREESRLAAARWRDLEAKPAMERRMQLNGRSAHG